VHYGASLPRNGSREILWDTGFLQIDPNGEFPWGDPTANEVEIWYSNRSRIAVQLVAPDGEETEWINPGNDSAAHRFAGGEEVIISSDPQTAWDGAACIYLRLNPGGERNWIRCGTWTIGLRALAVGDSEPDKGVRFDAWIERTIPDPGEDDRELWSRFVDYDRNAAITLTTPSTARRAITVASCDSNEMPKISDFSSRGKTRDERYKPEIAAPGKSVFSTNAGAGSGEPPAPARKEMYGTSMAAPHIAGVVARLLARQHYLTWEEIRDLLVRSAVLPAGVLPAGVEPPWEGQWGYGRVNAARAMQLLEARLR
jgi:subtilisin family serine protease